MKKINLKTFLIFLTLLVIIVSVTISYKFDERKNFERFLIKDIKSLNLKYDSEESAKVMMDKPEMAGIQDYYMTIDPKLKRVPHERLVSAIKEIKNRQKSTKSDLYDRYVWNEVPSDMGGRIRSFMFDPNDNDKKKVWAGSVTGGLWYNNNIYNNDSIWHPVSDVWENLSISSIVSDPNNSQIFYVGTGEPQTAVTIYRESSTRGVGIWKTVDGGNTWNLLPTTSDFPYISDIIIRDESGQSVIYAGVVSGRYQGEDHVPSPSDGLYKSDDGGSSWSQVLPNIVNETVPYSPSDIELASSNRIFVGTYRNIDGNGGASILYSDNGTDWTIFDNYVDSIEASSDETVVIPGRTMLASSESSPNTIYAVIAAGGFTSQDWIYYRGRYIVKSTDNGTTWKNQNLPYTGSSWATLAWHALTIEVDPNDENTVYAGGLNLHKSIDGGDSWEEISCWFNYGQYYDPNEEPYVHADQHCITFKPGSSDTICFTNDGGVFMTLNGTNSEINFTEKSKLLNTLQFYTCDLDPDSAENNFLGGLQDNGTVLYSGTSLDKEASFISGGDGAYCFFDNNDYLITTVYYNSIYVHNKTVDGYSFSFQKRFNSGTFISPSDYDDEKNTLYANAVSFTGIRADQILRINNITSSLNNYRYINVGTGSSTHFSHVKCSEYSEDINRTLYLGTQAGELFKVSNAQATPSSTNIGSGLFPTGNISCIAEGKDKNELLITFSNYGVSSVWFTNDGGSNWLEKEGNLPDIPVRWALFDPADTAKVLLATEVGVWGTNNIYAEIVTWEPITNGFPNVRVDMLQLRESDNTILAATHGRGLFYCDLEGGTTSTSIENVSITEELFVKVFPNPTSGLVKLSFAKNTNNNISISIFDEKGSLVKSINNKDISLEMDLDISDLNNGLYFINIRSDQNSVTKKIILRK